MWYASYEAAASNDEANPVMMWSGNLRKHVQGVWQPEYIPEFFVPELDAARIRSGEVRAC
jgi:hypothetical protein